MREIKFRAWHDGNNAFEYVTIKSAWMNGVECVRCGAYSSDKQFNSMSESEITKNTFIPNAEYEQFTGLRDKNGLTDIYEGDILNAEGIVYANVHEGNVGSRFDLLIASMGTATWRDTEQEAIKRGCFYAE